MSANIKSVRYASPFLRAAAEGVNFAILFLLLIVSSYPVGLLTNKEITSIYDGIVQLCFIFVYYPISWVQHGSTIGHRVFGLEVVDESGLEKLRASQAIGRVLSVFVPWIIAIVFLPINKNVSAVIFTLLIVGFCMAFFDKKNRPWFDKLSKSTVLIRQDGRRLQRVGKWIGALLFCIFVFLCFNLSVLSIVGTYSIPNQNMRNTILDGDYILSSNMYFKNEGRPKRGDIVVFRYPLNESIYFSKRCVATAGDELFFHNQDLYIHPKEGDEYAKTNFKGYEIVSIGGKLWVKNPYQKEHKGIHYENQKISAKDGDIRLDKRFYDPAAFYADRVGSEPVFETPFSMLEAEDVRLRKYFFGPITLGEDKFFMMGDNRDNSADSRHWGMVKYSQLVGKVIFVYWSKDENGKMRWNRMFRSVESLDKELK